MDAERPPPRIGGSQSAQRNYERYLALAQAQAQSGDVIGAENYYQHAEHYFRSMSGDRESYGRAMYVFELVATELHDVGAALQKKRRGQVIPGGSIQSRPSVIILPG